ncbi:hypothetical protein [Porphyromonas pogonae]|uniref:hypothetical protein n=1 Tax=Porphyromonas pogonae TaxID=867595 RepID=UPI002E774F4F|nr:hypothetical protein [Porphyromonas pogonae]
MTSILIIRRILTIILWLCAIACFTGFPWIFLGANSLKTYVDDMEFSSVTMILFRQQCLFFGFFCIYFLYLTNLDKYKPITRIASFLIGFMGIFMYWLKVRTHLDNISSQYEPFIWFVVGGLMFYLNKGIKGNPMQPRSLKIVTPLFRVIAFLLFLNFFSVIFPKQAWQVLSKIPYNSTLPFDRYTFGLISGFMAFSSIIVYFLSNKFSYYNNFSIAVTCFLPIYFIGFLVWSSPLVCFSNLFLSYVLLMIALSFLAIIYTSKNKYKYGK